MIIHTVKLDELISDIADFYNVTIEEIIELNKLPNPKNLLVGQSLIIPEKETIHIVKPGETLYEISEKYGVSLEDLLIINNIESPYTLYSDTQLIIPYKQKPEIDVNAYIYNLGESAIPIVKERGKNLSFLSPFAYLIDENGNLNKIKDKQAINSAYEENVAPMMTITNFTVNEKGENVAHIVLNDHRVQEKLIKNIVHIIKEKEYKGLNVDFENVYPQDRESYNRFLKLVVDRMHDEGYFVSTALAPKTSEEQMGQLYEAHDYKAHGDLADFVILMTYEWGYRMGPPRAISPINEIKKVLDYAVTVIPKDKIYFGFQIYARDWLLPYKEGQEAETFSTQEAIKRAAKYGAEIKYDTVAQSPYYRYEDEKGRLHEVWFEDARSAQSKFDLVKDYNLKGISYWVLGYPFPQNWELLNDNFNIKKFPYSN
ncbi:LysM peptidoglycan-binding domain-containing protein [Anaerovorax odorimutans]|uniref:LysM peptidoglycan-binding domain-containing protein n=1 Tax=Anaerovorax odorimutans TaxID=109327 RepID=UPI0003F5816D|nr:LysM peptidoglycan-binding domain-containing protein [Anaerovorax odorimutans]